MRRDVCSLWGRVAREPRWGRQSGCRPGGGRLPVGRAPAVMRPGASTAPPGRAGRLRPVARRPRPPATGCAGGPAPPPPSRRARPSPRHAGPRLRACPTSRPRDAAGRRRRAGRGRRRSAPGRSRSRARPRRRSPGGGRTDAGGRRPAAPAVVARAGRVRGGGGSPPPAAPPRPSPGPSGRQATPPLTLWENALSAVARAGTGRQCPAALPAPLLARLPHLAGVTSRSLLCRHGSLPVAASYLG